MFRPSLLGTGRALYVDCVAGSGGSGAISTTTVKSYAAATSGWDEVGGAIHAQMIMNVGSL